MYSVEEFLEQADQASDVDDDLERVVEQDDENGPHDDEAEEANEKKDDEEGSAKKVPKKVRKPSNRPKLDVERLKGPRGLATIEKLFTKVKFQGHGHEQEDLQAVMRTLHYWCHRLFPKYSFDDCLEHLERLGSKKPVITLKKKILFDLFEDDQPIINDADDANPDTQEAINEFDLLLQQEPISSLSQPERIELTEEQKEMIERNRLLAAERRKARLEALQQKQAQNSSNENPTSSQLTEEQKAIIERNRQQALERRRAKNNSNISITSSMVPGSEDANATIDTVTNSQKSNQSVNFNELVDSFFPASEDNDISQKSAEDGVDINDLIEEINPTTEEKPIETNKEIDINDLIEEIAPNTEEKSIETNKEVDINDLIEEMDPTTEDKSIETNKEIDIHSRVSNDLLDINEPSNTELNKNTIEDEMDVDKETSYDINSTKEDTATNLLEME